MPKTVPIEIFNIARTQVDREEVRRWLDFLGAPDFEIPEDGAVSNPALLIALAAKRCYKSFKPELNPNLTRVRNDLTEYLDNVMAQKHGSVLEHSVFTFAIENVSRVFTGEMNRHRAGWAISEGSMRFIRFSESIDYWMPACIAGDDVVSAEEANSIVTLAMHSRIHGGNPKSADLVGLNSPISNSTVELKRQLSREVFQRNFRGQEYWYSILEEIWAKELAPESKFAAKKEITSMMRRGVGMGCATGGVWSGNVRALRHVLTMRCEPAAEEEILHVFSRVAKRMKEQEPMLFGDFEMDAAGYYRPKYVKV